MENKQINADNQITFLDNDVANNFDISKKIDLSGEFKLIQTVYGVGFKLSLEE